MEQELQTEQEEGLNMGHQLSDDEVAAALGFATTMGEQAHMASQPQAMGEELPVEGEPSVEQSMESTEVAPQENPEVDPAQEREELKKELKAEMQEEMKEMIKETLKEALTDDE